MPPLAKGNVRGEASQEFENGYVGRLRLGFGAGLGQVIKTAESKGMNMKKIGSCVAFILVAGIASAETISLNFTGGGGAYSLSSSALAGLIGNESGNILGSTVVSNWNNLNGATGTGVGNLTSSAGSVVAGVAATWSADNVFSLPNTTGGANTTANTTMMRGYLDDELTNAITLTVSGLQPLSGTYSVVVFADGANASVTNWLRATYTIGATTFLNEDSESVDFNSGSGNNANGLFQIPVAGGTANQNWPDSPNNNEGNVMIFSGLTGSSFTLTATPGNTLNDVPGRAPINGIQIVGVIPEPATGILFAGAGLVGLGMRRLRRRI